MLFKRSRSVLLFGDAPHRVVGNAKGNEPNPSSALCAEGSSFLLTVRALLSLDISLHLAEVLTSHHPRVGQVLWAHDDDNVFIFIFVDVTLEGNVRLGRSCDP